MRTFILKRGSEYGTFVLYLLRNRKLKQKNIQRSYPLLFQLKLWSPADSLSINISYVHHRSIELSQTIWNHLKSHSLGSSCKNEYLNERSFKENTARTSERVKLEKNTATSFMIKFPPRYYFSLAKSTSVANQIAPKLTHLKSNLITLFSLGSDSDSVVILVPLLKLFYIDTKYNMTTYFINFTI